MKSYTTGWQREYFTYIVTRSAKSVGTGLKVGEMSRVSGNTKPENNISFNQ